MSDDFEHISFDSVEFGDSSSVLDESIVSPVYEKSEGDGLSEGRGLEIRVSGVKVDDVDNCWCSGHESKSHTYAIVSVLHRTQRLENSPEERILEKLSNRTTRPGTPPFAVSISK